MNEAKKTKYWHIEPNGRIQCDLCPRNCTLKNGQRGLCYIRGAENNEIVFYSYGKSSGFCVDPIEKKPLNHFYPGSSVFSFGTAGCNLACKFCQNWDISKSREMETLIDYASPQDIVDTTLKHGCQSIAFTYNDPVIFLEYAQDVSELAHQNDLKTVAVTAGYINPGAREDFFSFIDAANVDLKAFSDDFYSKICGAHLDPVLDTLLYLHKETNVWFEITTLLIPDENDSDEELNAMTEWIVEHLGPNIPLHFTAFHPDYKMVNKQNTSHQTLIRAQKIAKSKGINFVYLGNVHDSTRSSTYCPKCDELLIERDWYQLGSWGLDSEGRCIKCKTHIAGHFESSHGNWGRHREPVYIHRIK